MKAQCTGEGWKEDSFLPLHMADEFANTVCYTDKKLKNTDTRAEDPRKEKEKAVSNRYL